MFIHFPFLQNNLNSSSGDSRKLNEVQITVLFCFCFLILGNAHLYYFSDLFPYFKIDTSFEKLNILQFTSQLHANMQQQRNSPLLIWP